MTIPSLSEEPEGETQRGSDPPIWLRATVEDVQGLDFEAPTADSVAAEAEQLGDKFRSALPAQDGERPAENAAARVYSMLSAVLGMHFRPEHRNEPFGAMLVFGDGRRSPIPEDFRGKPLEALAEMAGRATNPVLRARLSDVCWLLDRQRGQLATAAVSAYVEIVQKIDAGEIKLRFEKEDNALHYEVRDLLRRALQIGRAIGWDKAETLRARILVAEFRQRANAHSAIVAIHWFSELDLDFGVSDSVVVAGGLDEVLKAIGTDADSHTIVDLWRLAARAYRVAKKEDDAYRCQAAAAECLVAQAENAISKQNSAMLASHSLSAAIAELHGIPGKKERRTELRHRLIDVQARIPEEMSVFKQEMDLGEIAQQAKKLIENVGLFDKLLVFASLANSPDPDDLAKEAANTIREHPLASLFGAAHLDSEGKVLHRTAGSALGDGESERRITQQEKLLAEMQDEGQDLSLVRMTLRMLKDLQAELEKQRDDLLRELQSKG